MAISISISITQNSQSVENNTSNVTVKVNASWTGGSHNSLQKSGWLKIDGTQYNFTSSFNTSGLTSGSQTLFTKTVDVSHISDGTKTLSCSASYTSGVSSGTVTASASKTLTTIPRKSTLTVGNGTLGTSMTLTITRKSSSFKHRIHYVLNGTTTYIAGGSSSYTTATSISWRPPLSIASTCTTATSRSFSVCLTTYTSDGTYVGEEWRSFTLSIPSSVKPSCSISVTEPTGYSGTYGGYIQGLSKLKITISPTLAYNSPISSYYLSANGYTYNSSSVTTGILKTSGSNSISAKVTDKRGRSGTASKSITVLAYKNPVISKLKVNRCDQNGTENAKGEYVKVTFSGTVTSLNDKNSATYTLNYKKTSDAEYTGTIDCSSLANTYSVTDQSYIFAADGGSSYDVKLELSDDFGSSTKTTSASTAYCLLHFNTDGTAIGIGKISEKSNTLEVGTDAEFIGPAYGTVKGLSWLPKIVAEEDLNDYIEPGMYAILYHADAQNISNIPLPYAGTLEVSNSTGDAKTESGYAYFRQVYKPQKNGYPTYVRNITRNSSDVWSYSDWHKETHSIVESSTWINGRKHALLASFNTPESLSAYHPLASVKTYSGAWTSGTFNNKYCLTYTTDSNYNSQTNSDYIHGLMIDPSDRCISGYRMSINNSGSDTYYNAQNGTYSISFGIGSGGVNRGIYDHTREHWTLLNDANYTYLRSPDSILLVPKNNAYGYIEVQHASSKPAIFPSVNNGGYVGISSYRFTTFFSVNAVNVSSDRRLKEDISDDFTKLEDFFTLLRPVSYKLKSDEEEKTHMGFIAQDIEEALEVSGIDPDTFAFLTKDDIDPESESAEIFDDGVSYGLGYTELIALNTHMIQKQKSIIDEQQKKIEDLESRLAKLEALLDAE